VTENKSRPATRTENTFCELEQNLARFAKLLRYPSCWVKSMGEGRGSQTLCSFGAYVYAKNYKYRDGKFAVIFKGFQVLGWYSIFSRRITNTSVAYNVLDNL
jgi:hypothetical protein